MKIVNLGESNSVLNRFVAELRDVNIQKDSMRFRRNIERIGEIMAYEISKDFTYSKKGIQSPLGIAPMNTPDDSVCHQYDPACRLPTIRVSSVTWIMRKMHLFPLTGNTRTV